jgi:polyisoprenoid-binding protein YceI
MSTVTIPSSYTGPYVIDPAHSHIGFAVRQAVVSTVVGSFRDFAGDGYLDADSPPRSYLSLTIDAASIETGNERRDAHLRGEAFLDVGRHRTISFISTSVEGLSAGGYRVSGDLTIKKVTEPVAVTFECTGATIDSIGDPRIWFEGTTIIRRRDWGLTGNAASDLLIGTRATLRLEVAATRTH